ncbi:MAG: alpha/beta hydrolase, partial [Candidatus Krumholzibacteriia bacterium]
MRDSVRWIAPSLAAVLATALLVAPPARAIEETRTFGRFGTVYLYHEAPSPTHVVLFVSGDGGWNEGVVDMARNLAGMDALVVGVDIIRYLKALEASSETCLYPASDFEALSQFVQKDLAYPAYVAPVLVGYSSGATLVYAMLAQAPAATFRGAISLGFCPDLPLTRPMCRGNGLTWGPGPHGKGYSFEPARHLETPWIALQGTIDQVCDPASTEAFVGQTPGARVMVLPKVGHGYAVPKNWLPQFREAFGTVLAAPSADPTRQMTEPEPAVPPAPADGAEADVSAPGDPGD